MTIYAKYLHYSQRRRRHAARDHTRLDIQGLRMVAVLTVFANHLWGHPSGGFVGVDVFFVISGFLITSNLLRSADKPKGRTGVGFFGDFYWKRIRRIMPAATVVLVCTVIASYAVFLPFRAREVGVDSIWAFLFASNWWFGYQGTDYFRAAADTVSPLQHYWSLSIEEQFYFVWPALIFLIGIAITRKAWTHSHRMQIAGIAMFVIVAASLTWAIFETATSPAWAYFNTFGRVWELGVGALLACSVGALTRIPDIARPLLSWAGLMFIGTSLFVISDTSAGFPAPWAILPVAGAALVIAAGVGVEPNFQAFLRNPVSGYIGDVSYSLYLWHWPVIVILGAVMPRDTYFYVTVLALTFALSVASFHYIENPMRYGSWTKTRETIKSVRKREAPMLQPAGAVALFLIAVAASTYALQPVTRQSTSQPPVLPERVTSAENETPPLGPLATTLQSEIVAALNATEWPVLDPSIEATLAMPATPPGLEQCGGVDIPAPDECTWGSPEAPIRVVLVGDSVALMYAGPLRRLALDGRIQLRVEALAACPFFETNIDDPNNPEESRACPGRKQNAIDVINSSNPDVVVISNSTHWVPPGQWAGPTRRIIEDFRANAAKVVWIPPPPADKDIDECYGTRASVPADCISQVTSDFASIVSEVGDAVTTVGGVTVESLPWFCHEGLCPAFAGTTPMKRDRRHLSPAYGEKIAPVVGEAFNFAGIF